MISVNALNYKVVLGELQAVPFRHDLLIIPSPIHQLLGREARLLRLVQTRASTHSVSLLIFHLIVVLLALALLIAAA
jgi:hypothetical protein